MSARFHFDLENSHDVIRDEDGVELRDVARAIAHAAAEVERMRHAGELEETPAGWSLVIRDAAGTEIGRIRI